ncbi:hypothetical protein KV580_21935 [Pseudomonas chlororaphis]|nr:hypothetical protein [Pseudomonas chlororaphis]
MKSVSKLVTRPAVQPIESARNWVQISLGQTQLLSLRFAQDIYTHSMTGRHWISWDGCDLLLEQGQIIKLTAGMALIDGEGVMQVAPANAPKHVNGFSVLRKWLGPLFMPSRTLALRIDIN